MYEEREEDASHDYSAERPDLETAVTAGRSTTGEPPTARASPTSQACAAAVPAATTPEAPATSSAHQPRGRIALLERSLEKENYWRMALLQQEHDLRCTLLKEDHRDQLGKKSAQHKV
ncbi:unnamed protein product [Ixodes pacificus]